MSEIKIGDRVRLVNAGSGGLIRTVRWVEGGFVCYWTADPALPEGGYLYVKPLVEVARVSENPT